LFFGGATKSASIPARSSISARQQFSLLRIRAAEKQKHEFNGLAAPRNFPSLLGQLANRIIQITRYSALGNANVLHFAPKLFLLPGVFTLEAALLNSFSV